VQEYKNKQFIVRYDEKICSHSGNCVKGLPRVFDIHRDPWINVNEADNEAIKKTVGSCPSGALSYENVEE
jgi:uncharacterized Fe-S cluster protein YjdI